MPVIQHNLTPDQDALLDRVARREGRTRRKQFLISAMNDLTRLDIAAEQNHAKLLRKKQPPPPPRRYP